MIGTSLRAPSAAVVTSKWRDTNVRSQLKLVAYYSITSLFVVWFLKLEYQHLPESCCVQKYGNNHDRCKYKDLYQVIFQSHINQLIYFLTHKSLRPISYACCRHTTTHPTQTRPLKAKMFPFGLNTKLCAECRPWQERGQRHLQARLSLRPGRSLPHRGQTNPQALLHDSQHRHRHRGDRQCGCSCCLYQQHQEKGPIG